ETQYSELAHLIQKAILRKRNEKLLQQGTPTREENFCKLAEIAGDRASMQSSAAFCQDSHDS
ncbi:MAG: hypothetical protein ACXADX_20270, partial [Candidatus Hodarchaeales archaeon]